MSRGSSAPAGPADRVEEIYRRRGFTLLELCVVLLIMALLAGMAMPALSSAFTEQALRSDAHQFSLMVKTGMLKSREQDRPYVLDLADKSIALQPVVAAVAPPDDSFKPLAVAAVHSDQEPDPAPPPEDVTMESKLANVFKLPDAQKKDAWEKIDSASWTFRRGDLCPLPRVRLERGEAWIEMSFNALTGNVEDETASIP